MFSLNSSGRNEQGNKHVLAENAWGTHYSVSELIVPFNFEDESSSRAQDRLIPGEYDASFRILWPRVIISVQQLKPQGPFVDPFVGFSE